MTSNTQEIDLSQTTIQDVYRAFNNDKVKAEATLSEFRQEQKNERDRNIKVVQEIYPTMEGSIIINTLIKNQWRVEETITELLPLHEEMEQESKNLENEREDGLLEEEEEGPVEEEQEVKEQEVEEEEEVKSTSMEEQWKESTQEQWKKEEEVKLISNSPMNEIEFIVSSNQLQCQEKFTIQFKEGTQHHSKAWIGMYSSIGLKGKDHHYITYQWISNAKEITFHAPNYPCQLEFKYFSKKYQRVPFKQGSTSPVVYVGPQFKLISILKEKEIHGEWNQTSGEPIQEQCWVGLYPILESSNSKYIAYKKTTPEHPHFMMDVSLLSPGEYHLRLFTSSMLSNYVELSRGETIHLTGVNELELSLEDGEMVATPKIVTLDPYASSCWIGLYSLEQENPTLYVDYSYVADRIEKIKFKIPLEEGVYEVRIYADSGYKNVLLKSNSVEVSH
jgi:hypothetical protein